MLENLLPPIEYLTAVIRTPDIAQTFSEISALCRDDETLGKCIRLASALGPQSVEAKLDLSILPYSPCTPFLDTVEAILSPLKEHENLQKLGIYGTYSNEMCTTLANVLRNNDSLKQIHVDSEGVNDDIFELQAALAMANALKQNSKLTRFLINVEWCTFEACVALIGGLKHSSLKVFRFWAILQHEPIELASSADQEEDVDLNQQKMCASLAAALANSVISNSFIEHIVVDLGITRNVSDDFSNLTLTLWDALAKNTSLIAIHLSFLDRNKNFELNEYCKRNLELRKLCFVLAQLAKPTDAFNSLKSANVRQQVFSFFLPQNSKPAHIFHMLRMTNTSSILM